ncbi:hypothetical protein G5V58_12890 [Nocardioides anomalus]|uniref:DUF7948 domain-containing protein n=1 Tax=Nocardioides anomalus TaxID=2712223 RepID=A0A6G6WDY4_9ACTN|nr:SBBP repeat-containing protein [Nocardioides anomalus]QIG43538.1 hypothetical protein G5V58_12890 [Nocardioides anomalus]
MALLAPALAATAGPGAQGALAQVLPHDDPPTASAGPEQSYARLPLSFVRDGGTFTARTAAGTVTLRHGEAVVVPQHGERTGTPVVMGLAGAAQVAPQVQQRLPGVLNDLRGDDPSAWRTDVPTFGRVRYAEVYPGVDLDYHGTTGTLEYDFRLAPGADPDRIAVDFHGAALRLTRTGALVVGTGADRIRQAAPVAFQPSPDGRDAVPARFTLDGDRVGFSLGAHDPSRALVIDPLVLSYATLLGGAGDDRVADIAVDATGAAYLSGWTDSDAFPTTGGAYDTSRSGLDAIVTKLNPAGTALVYSTLLGGSGTDFADTVAVDSSGSAYVAGQTQSIGSAPSRFPTTAGAYTTASGDAGFGDAFVTRLNPAGNGLTYSAVFGGSDQEEVRAIALDPSGAAYAGGYTASTGNASTTFPSSPGAYQLTPRGTSRDGFVVKLDASGARAYATYLGGQSQDEVNGIDVDPQGHAYVTGFAYGSTSDTFPTTSATRFAPVEDNGVDAYLSRLSADGSTLEYSTGIGTDGNGSANNGSDFGYAVAVGPSEGTAYITGTSLTGSGPNGDFPLKHPYEGRNGSCCYGQDLFVAEFDTTRSGDASLVYSTLIGGGGAEGGTAIDVDSTGAAYVGGVVASESQPGDPYDTTPDELGGGAGRGRAFVTKVVQSGSGNAGLGFSTTLQGTSYLDGLGGLVYDETAGAVHVGGTSRSGSLLTTPGAFQTAGAGDRDGFAATVTVGTTPPDTTAPDTTITSGPAAGSTLTGASVSFGFSATESSTFECAYDGGGFAACGTPSPGLSGSDTRTLANGSHTFAVRARDAAANADPTPATRTFTVAVAVPPPPAPPADTTPPDTVITQAPPARVRVKRKATVSVGFTSTEPGSRFTCRVDGGPAQPCVSGAAFRLGRGQHTITVTAVDAAGNADPAPASVRVTVKKKRPRPGAGGGGRG